LKRFLASFFATSFIVVSAQDALTTLSSNHLLFKANGKQELTARGSNDSANHIIDYEIVDLPFVDEFSTNKQRPPFNQLPTSSSEYYVIGSCSDFLKYKKGLYKFSTTPSKEYTYLPGSPPDFVQITNLTFPSLFSLNDTPNCNTIVQESLYPPTIMKRFSSTGQLLWDSVVYDTTIYCAQIKEYFVKGYLWTDRHAYINSHLPYMPPSKGVATLDGLNEYGAPYNKEMVNAYGLADYLTSAPINLQGKTGNDSIYLSFLIQPQGLGDYPDEQDSIQVEFRDDRGRWISVWTQKGVKQEIEKNSLKFTFATIHIPDPIVPSDPFYFYDKFQFRFKNHATISGNNDHWHIDFVRLDENRNYLDTSLRDFNFVYELPSVLKYHTLLPTQQYRGSQDLEDSIIGINHNILQATLFNSYKFRCFNENTGTVYGSSSTTIPFPADPLVFHSLQVASQLNFPTTIDDSSFVTTKIYFDQGDDYITNDTATSRQFFFNEMAYDDGTAEWAYGLQGLGTKKVAYRYFIPNKDTLAAVKILFSNIDVPVSSLLFNLTIWKKIGMNGQQEEVLKTLTNLKPKYLDSLNSYVTFGLDEPLEVQDTIYVGWIQADERNLQIGYDVNSAKGYDNLFILTNNVWSKSNIAKSRAGSPMIRLILDGVRKFSTNQLVNAATKSDSSRISFYPNPASQFVNFNFEEQRNIEISVYDMLGKLVIQQSSKEGLMDVSQLQNGLYYVHFTKDGQWLRADKLQIVR
jgi:Secretion system C-terminal sorting domain